MRNRKPLILLLALASPVFAQEMKSTPASDALVAAAKEYTTASKATEGILTQARTGLEIQQKDAQAKLAAVTKELDDRVKADKKYAHYFAEISDLQKQIQDNQTKAEQQYQSQAGPLNQKVASDKALIDGLIPIVRKESGMPESATFDIATQKWSTPKK